jgi:glycosyltransferase involved in cell wall biosynthesis
MPEIERFVSVIVPAFNAERFIERTLNSALNQTCDSFEVIVVDDGSTDRTAALVEKVAARDGRVRLIQTKNSGVAAARNLGISQARGSLIAPLDADDLWHPDKLTRQLAIMRALPQRVGLVYCWTVDIDENDFIIPPIRNKCIARGNVVEELAARNNFIESGSVPLIRRSCLDAVGGYDPNLKGNEDWKLYLALAEICEFAVLPAHLVGYRQSSMTTSRNIGEMERGIDDVERWILSKWPNLRAEVRRQMFYHSNSYLAHRALTANDFTGATRYYLRGVKAEPWALLSRESCMFTARFLARLFGIRKSAFSFQALPVRFRDFEPERGLKTEHEKS